MMAIGFLGYVLPMGWLTSLAYYIVLTLFKILRKGIEV
jgi:hypothetical protein